MADSGGVIDRAVGRLHTRLGPAYRHTFLVAELTGALAIAVIAVLLLTSYYHPSAHDVLVMVGVGVLSSSTAVCWAMRRSKPLLEQVSSWQSTEHPTREHSNAAWDAATNFPVRSFRANAIWVNAIAATPIIAAIILTLGLGWSDVPTLVAACVVPAAYATVLNYFLSETLMRPWVAEIAAALPEDFPFVANGLPIRRRLKVVLPVFTGFVGLVVAALMSGRGGSRVLAESVAAAVGIGLLFSFELTVLLSRSVTAPIFALRDGLARVRAGDYDARVPVITSDELGELSHSFNLMAAGLAEREHIRSTFGTYLDADIVPLILDGSFPPEGVAVTVSIMFVDVRDFSAFAAHAEPREVVAALNALFEVMVPIVGAHGGHVDKFMGDGMLASFGPPEGYHDHADRAVAAGLQIVQAVNRAGARLEVGVGINTGTVVAGSIGGAGRLNFSVIGDAVNTAARVEEATRDTGDALLLTRATRDAMRRPIAVTSRGTVPLKGRAEPLEILACEGAAGWANPRVADAARADAVDRRRSGSGRGWRGQGDSRTRRR